ncbi:MAG: CBS domain-containing protein [Candidatus Altiarchaeota archaeon]
MDVDVCVRELMSSPVIHLSPDKSVKEAAQLIAEKKIGCMLVKGGGKFVGILTERDIVERVVAKGLDPNETKIKDVMTADFVTAPAETSFLDANDLMSEKKIRRLPLTEEGEIVGIITIRDIQARMSYSQLEGEIGSFKKRE